MEIFQIIIYCLFLLFVVYFFLTAVALTKLIFKQDRELFNMHYRKYKQPTRVFVQRSITMLLLLAVAVFCQFVFKQIIRSEINSIVVRYDPARYIVYVNDKRVDDPEPIVAALIAPYNGAYHHSSKGKNITVRIVGDTDSLTIDLRRDTDVENEYWVHCNKYKLTRDNELGKITSSALDGY